MLWLLGNDGLVRTLERIRPHGPLPIVDEVFDGLGDHPAAHAAQQPDPQGPSSRAAALEQDDHDTVTV